LYIFFAIPNYFFFTDFSQHIQLIFPNYFLSNKLIGIALAINYGLIALAATIIYKEKKLENVTFWGSLFTCFVLNTAYLVLPFKSVDLFLIFVECFLLAVSTWVLIIFSRKIKVTSFFLLLPYGIWTTLSTFFTYAIYLFGSN
jgi:tryptophan-rich sensory protein